MKLLSELLALNEAHRKNAIIKEDDIWDDSDALEQWMEEHKVYHFEGPSGYAKLEKLMSAIGYRTPDEFFADNSGAMNAIVEWIREQLDHNDEWNAGLRNDIKEQP